jgi:lipopolysaccharide/colanic/teichoic acid biosynthesis glycosyltransferase
VQERIKCILDIVVAALGVGLFAPILAITSIAIKLDSRGPVFVREIKYGYKNREIQILKFRFATSVAECDPINGLTRVGRVS